MTIFRERDHDRFVTISKDEPIEVRLREDPSTGYGWHLAAWDQAMLKKEKEVLEPLENASDERVEHVWMFHPLRVGETPIEIGHRMMSQGPSDGVRYVLDFNVE